jgi:hypothetical protein
MSIQIIEWVTIFSLDWKVSIKGWTSLLYSKKELSLSYLLSGKWDLLRSGLTMIWNRSA